MTTNTATSVSTGCFVYKGKYSRANKLNYLPEEDPFLKHRLKHCEQQWDEIALKIDVLRADLNCQIFEDLVAFILSCHKERHSVGKYSTSEIPTAVLVTGVNTPDHGVMFSNLRQILKSKVTPLIARIFPKDCLRISSLIGSLFHQLTDVAVSTDEVDEEDNITADESLNFDEISQVLFKKTVKRKPAISMSSLSKWYETNYGNSDVESSPRKKSRSFSSPRKKSGADNFTLKPHIVIMMEEVENMNASVLHDFISLSSSYLSVLPIVLVFGIATAVTAIHQILPCSASSLMCMEKFHAPPASQYLSHLLDQLIIATNIPFKLGPKTFHFLLDNFLYHDFSIINFILGFKLCMIEHFMTNPLSVLCCPPELVDSTVSKLTHGELEQLRRNSAIMRYVEGTTGPFQAKLHIDDAATRQRLAAEVQNLHSFHKTFFPVLSFLHRLGLSLPRYPLGKQLREVYSTCLLQNISESEGYKQAFTFLRLMCCEELHELLGSCLKTIEAQKYEKNLAKLYYDVEQFRYRLQHLDEEKEEEIQTDASVKVLPVRAKLHELKEKLQSMSSVRRRSPYELLREEILLYLDEQFQCHLVSPMNLPLQEILYFNDLPAIKDHIRPSPRYSIQTALTDPGKVLSCACCQCSTDSILPTMPDLCIIYKLHLECGSLVNLYDWLQAFVLIISSNHSPQNKSQKTKGPTVEQRARFIRAVSELQFLGFIKSTQRKTDHVTRLTW